MQLTHPQIEATLRIGAGIEACVRVRWGAGLSFVGKTAGADGKLGTSSDKNGLQNVLPIAIDSVKTWSVGLELTATLKIVEYIVKKLEPEQELAALLEDLQIDMQHMPGLAKPFRPHSRIPKQT
jgi:hypothetical protein